MNYTVKPKIVKFFILCFFVINYFSSLAQDNYEIQVYPSETISKKSTMFELHSNMAFDGFRKSENNTVPTNTMQRETIEITHGINDWFEIGFYLFNAIGDNKRTGFVGSHIRPRVKIPDAWHLPVGLSLGGEFGYQNKSYATDDLTLEIRGIIDKKWKKWYWAFNAAFDKSLSGINKNKEFEFAPSLKGSYNINEKIALGLEYYNSAGSLTHFYSYEQQQHLLFAAIDLDWSPKWEFNAGYGIGFTSATENKIIKVILGYKLGR